MKHKLSCFNSIVTAEAKVEREGDRAKLTHGGRRLREGVQRGGVAVRGDGAGVPGGGRRRVRVRPPRHGGARAEDAAPPRPQRTPLDRAPPLSQQFQFVLSNPCAEDPEFIVRRVSRSARSPPWKMENSPSLVRQPSFRHAVVTE